jgi:glutamyl-Q tRNA(Asp) synthetase
VSDAKSSSAIATTGTGDPPVRYRGRFAPSPSGPLHFGSLVAAVGSFLEARTRGGEWLVRIEDIDPPRCRPGADDQILRALERLGLTWDGPILYQSTRRDAYVEAFEQLRAAERLRPCRCSRAQLAALPSNLSRSPGEELRHPPECVAGSHRAATTPAWRLRVPDLEFEFVDRVQGPQIQNAARSGGDFVVRRRDGGFAYQLAVVVDDAAQGVTDVVRGADLLESTVRQILMQRSLRLPGVTYMHLPLAVDASGAKLSKSGVAPDTGNAVPTQLVVAVLEFLRQAPPPELRRAPLEEVWAWARQQWQPSRFSGMRSGAAPTARLDTESMETPA